MSKSKEDKAPESVPVPNLALDPPSASTATLPGPQPPEPGGPEQTPRRMRKRRTKAELDRIKREAELEGMPEGVSPEDVARTELALAATFEVISTVIAKRRGAHWQFDKEESATLGKTWTAALAPYLPKIGAAVPWAAAAAVTWSMVQPRLARDAELQQQTPPDGPKLA